MASETQDQHTSNPQSAGDSGGEKLYAGKYKSVEDLEKAYKESEKRFHEGNERFSRLEEKIDLLTQRDEGYGRGQAVATETRPASNSTQLLTRFYSEPDAVFAEVEQRATQRAKSEILQQQQAENQRAARVQAWTAQNPDVAQYPELLTYWVGQTDGRLSIEARLDQGATRVRQRVLEMKGKPAATSSGSDEFVESPQGGSAGSAGGHGGSKPAAAVDAESQLAAHVNSRNKHVRKPLGQHSVDAK